jgi:hypothetical protein
VQTVPARAREQCHHYYLLGYLASPYKTRKCRSPLPFLHKQRHTRNSSFPLPKTNNTSPSSSRTLPATCPAKRSSCVVHYRFRPTSARSLTDVPKKKKNSRGGLSIYTTQPGDIVAVQHGNYGRREGLVIGSHIDYAVRPAFPRSSWYLFLILSPSFPCGFIGQANSRGPV